MKNLSLAVLLVVGLTACGGDDSTGDDGSDLGSDPAPAATQSPANEGDDGGGAATEPAGPAEPNTFVVGGEVWVRVTPMTEGQCFLPAEDGGNPVNGTAWGPMEGDGIQFSVDYSDQGSHEADVEGPDSWWAAGSRVGTEDLVVEVDHETNTISGYGTFSNLRTGETAQGSFNIQCEEDG